MKCSAIEVCYLVAIDRFMHLVDSLKKLQHHPSCSDKVFVEHFCPEPVAFCGLLSVSLRASVGSALSIWKCMDGRMWQCVEIGCFMCISVESLLCAVQCVHDLLPLIRFAHIAHSLCE